MTRYQGIPCTQLLEVEEQTSIRTALLSCTDAVASHTIPRVLHHSPALAGEKLVHHNRDALCHETASRCSDDSTVAGRSPTRHDRPNSEMDAIVSGILLDGLRLKKEMDATVGPGSVTTFHDYDHQRNQPRRNKFHGTLLISMDHTGEIFWDHHENTSDGFCMDDLSMSTYCSASTTAYTKDCGFSSQPPGSRLCRPEEDPDSILISSILASAGPVASCNTEGGNDLQHSEDVRCAYFVQPLL